VGIEARGFIFAPALAYRLGAGFVPVRKPKKLPWKTAEVTYQLEYGTDQLQIHQDGVKPGSDVLLCDDLLATGGTAAAAIQLIRQLGGKVVGAAFAVELSFPARTHQTPRRRRFLIAAIRQVAPLKLLCVYPLKVGAPHVEFTCGGFDSRFTILRRYLFRVPHSSHSPAPPLRDGKGGRLGLQSKVRAHTSRN
jgi:hypothetical protein